MKKLIRLFALSLAIMLLAGCSANSYRYVDKGDKSYIVLDSDSQSSLSSAATQSLAPYVYFSSISEMIEDIQEGNFTEEEKMQIAKFSRNNTGNISTMSLDNLYEPIAASNYSIDSVSWTGKYYGVEYKDESTGETVNFSMGGKRHYDLEQQINANVEKVAIKSEPDPTRKNGRLYHVVGMDGGKYKLILFEITDGSKTLHVREYYPNTTSTVPDLIVINGTENGLYYKVSIMEIKTRPSLEKLTAFGLREYAETETS